jgi:hypothetical protein
VLRFGRYVSYGGLLVSPNKICSYVVTGAYITCCTPGSNHSLVLNIAIKLEKGKYILQLQSYLKNFLKKTKYILKINCDTSFQDLSFSKSGVAAFSLVHWANMLVFLLH